MELPKVYDELYGMIEDLKKQINGGGAGTKNYNELENRPYINSKLLTGNKNSKQIGVAEYITSGDYAELESPSEHEIYFASDRPEVINWGITYAAASINWTEGDSGYTATVGFATGSDGIYYKSVLSATVNDEAITIKSTQIERSPSPGIVLSLSCEDIGTITESSLRFTVDFETETGPRKIIHNGMRYGYHETILYDDPDATAITGDLALSESMAHFDAIGISVKGGGYNAYNVYSVSDLLADVTYTDRRWFIGTDSKFWFFYVKDATTLAKAPDNNTMQPYRIIGITY